MAFHSAVLRGVPGAAFRGSQGGTVHQPHQIARVATEAEAPWVIWALRMQRPAPPSAHPYAPSIFSLSTVPRVHVGSYQSRVFRRWRQAQANFYLPICTERTIGAPASQQGTQHAACRLQSPSRSQALDKTGGLSWQKPHPADSLRFGTVAHWESCTLTAPCNSCMLLLSFGALSLCLFGTWKM